MNGKDIFLGLKYVGDDLIEKAEYDTFQKSKVKRNCCFFWQQSWLWER